MNFFEKSNEIKDYMIDIRRRIHENPELAFDLEDTTNLVKEELDKLKISYTSPIENSVLASLGAGDKTILLRADMDALPIEEENDLDFKSKNQCGYMCGHDFHTAMLLGTAKILKEIEEDLDGVVKLMFQPAEEILKGSEKMIRAGILENPKVDRAMMVHMDTTRPLGIYIKEGAMATSNNNFRIKVKEKSSHGAMPENGIDAAFVASQIVNGLQEIVSRELSFTKGAVLTTGHIKAGSAPNIIPDKATIEGTCRTYHEESKKHIQKRIPELSKYIAKAYRAEASFEILSDVPAIINDEEFYKDAIRVLYKVKEENEDFNLIDKCEAVTASDDFANVAKDIPSLMLMVGCKVESGEVYPLHNGKAIFNENLIVYGPTTMASLAYDYLKGENK